MVTNGSQTTTKSDELSPAQYFEYRFNSVQELKGTGPEPYPHKFSVSTRIDSFISSYSHIQDGVWLDDEVSVAGRIFSKRIQGKNLIFYDLVGDGCKIQIMSKSNVSKDPDFHKIHEIIHRGDIVGFIGCPGRTKKGELSLLANTSVLLAPCLYMMPNVHFGLRDRETRYRKRYLDLILNESTRKKMIMRSKAIQYIRNFLDRNNFIEVETPILNTNVGGASAKPFATFHNHLDLNMFLRIAPELPLKTLVIGGLNRVYEIGRQFRNESIDLTHNPEFTTCEFYMAYGDYEDLMRMTEELLSGLVHSICGSYKISFHPHQTDHEKGQCCEIDFTPPYKKIVLMDELEKAMNIKFPQFNDLGSSETRVYFDKLCLQHKVECPEPRTTARLLDKLVGHFLETQITNPTFIIDHPQIMCPLAKWHRQKPGFSERFELFVCGRELVNAYTELNDPKVQRDCFLQQAQDREAGDEEAQILDEDYCVAMEHGLPPCAGWGLGIDRLVMFITDSNNIKEVIAFPATKPIETNPNPNLE